MNIEEAFPSAHFDERLEQRFGPLTSPDFNYSLISKKVDFLYRFKFPEKTIVGVLLFKSKVTYKAPAKSGEKPSIGHEIWALVNNNELETIFFSKNGRNIINAEFFISVDDLIRYSTETGLIEINRNKLQSLVNRVNSKQPIKEPAKELNLPTMTILGDVWYIDYAREELLNKRDINDKMSFDKAFESLPEDELEKIMAQI